MPALEGQEVLLPASLWAITPACKQVDAPRPPDPAPARLQRSRAGPRLLEKEGIGRPSTYASIIGTIVDRGYATLANNFAHPQLSPLLRYPRCW